MVTWNCKLSQTLSPASCFISGCFITATEMELSTLDVKKCDGLEEVVRQQDVGLKTLLRIPGWMKML